MLGSYYQPYSCCGAQIHAKLPRQSVPPIKEISDPSLCVCVCVCVCIRTPLQAALAYLLHR